MIQHTPKQAGGGNSTTSETESGEDLENSNENSDDENLNNDEISAQAVSFTVQVIALTPWSSSSTSYYSYSALNNTYSLYVGRFYIYWLEGDGGSGHGSVQTWGNTPTTVAAYGYSVSGGSSSNYYAENLVYISYSYGWSVQRYARISKSAAGDYVCWSINTSTTFEDSRQTTGTSFYTYIYGEGITSTSSPSSSVGTTFSGNWYIKYRASLSMSYDSNGGTSTSSQTFYAGQSLTLASAPTRTGYSFNGWLVTNGSRTIGTYSAGTSIAWSDLRWPSSSNGSYTYTATAQWTPSSYTNYYYYRNSSGTATYGTASRTYASSFTMPTSSTYSYYTSNGWSLDGWAYNSSTSTSRTYSADEEVSNYNSTTGSLSFYAIARRTIQIIYNANAGNDTVSGLPETQSEQYWNMYGDVYDIQSLEISSNTPTRSGYTFQGWSTDSSATTADPNYTGGTVLNFTYSSSESVTLYAVWIQNTVYYYRDSSGNLTSTTQERTYGTNFTTLSSVSGIYSSNGWNLIGWATGSSATSETYGLGESVSAYNSSTSQVELYAIAQRTIQITYNANAGSDAVSGMPNTTSTTQYWNMYGTSSSYYSTYSLTVDSTQLIRTGYTFLGWSTNSLATTADSSYAGGTTVNFGYNTSNSITLYAVWEANVYTITLNHENGDNSTDIYVKYATGFYSTSAATSGSEITSVTLPTRSGYSFQGYYTGQNGTGTQAIDENRNIVISTTYLDDNYNIYAYWTVNVPAYYDNENGYWYIEYGYMPQTKVTDSTTITALGSATTGGGTYYFAGESYTAVVYNDNEYCYILENWYLVEPIRWIIYSGNELTSGSVVQVSTAGFDYYMVTASIVDVGAFADSYVGLESGYSTTNSYITNFQENISGYLGEFNADVQTFGTSGTTSSSTSAYIFLSSAKEIQNALGTMAASFSDLVLDYLSSVGSYYFTRDLGTNLNNIYVYSRAGSQTQKLATSVYGMRFTVKFTEFVCVES